MWFCNSGLHYPACGPQMTARRAPGPRSQRHNGSHCSAGLIRADAGLGPSEKRSRQPRTCTQVLGPEPWVGGGVGLGQILLTQWFCLHGNVFLFLRRISSNLIPDLSGNERPGCWFPVMKGQSFSPPEVFFSSGERVKPWCFLSRLFHRSCCCCCDSNFRSRCCFLFLSAG